MSKRAERRAEAARLRAHVVKLYGSYAKGNARAIGRLVNTRVPCSCEMCSPRRKYVGPRIQELRRPAEDLT